MALRWRLSTLIKKKDSYSTFLVTTVQKDALLSVIKALDIDVTEHALLEEEEDISLMTAMEEGLKSGIATEQEKNDFESFLFGADAA